MAPEYRIRHRQEGCVTAFHPWTAQLPRQEVGLTIPCDCDEVLLMQQNQPSIPRDEDHPGKIALALRP